MHRLMLLAVLPLAAHAAEPVHARYAVYGDALGITMNVAIVHTDFLVGPDAYQVRLRFHTAGAVGFVVTANSDSTATGRFTGEMAAPERYTSVGRLRGEPRQTELDYAGNDDPQIRVLIPATEPLRDPVPPAQQAGTIDTLSAMAMLIHAVNTNGRCDGHVTAFDGHRLIAFTSRTAGTQDLPPTGHSTFAGPTLRCDIVSQQLAGFKHDADEARLRRPQSGNAWFARLSPDGPLVLVRAVFPTTFFGTTTLYLQPGGE
jgi:hypothetical protein